MCGLGNYGWLVSLSLLILFSAIVTASVVFVVRELGKPKRGGDDR
jgi:hypothetical protein